MSEEKNQKSLDQKQLEKLRKGLGKIEAQIAQMKRILLGPDVCEELSKIDTKKAKNYTEGVFDGEQMVDKEGKKYQVPANYASKSKLVAGDVLKLVIAADGTFIYKQIAPVERKKLIGILEKTGEKYHVKVDGKYYSVLLASVTYFKTKVGDKLTIVVPKDKETDWAAVENKIE